MNAPLVRVRGLTRYYTVRVGWWGRRMQFAAVDHVDLDVARGETLALVGESGCGKTTLGRCLLRLVEPHEGRIEFDGTDLGGLRGGELRRFRRRLQPIFQDPGAALDPRLTVRACIEEPLRLHGWKSGSRLRDRVMEVCEQVGIEPEWLARYPSELSGGQQQRVAIARALALEPDFIVCDEPTSALDVSVQAQVVDLLRRIQKARGVAYLFITHDLHLVPYLAHRVAIMYLGRLVEVAPVDEILYRPRHPYTRLLLDSVPRTEPAARNRRPPVLSLEPPSPLQRPAGCAFRPRCPLAEAVCQEREPELEDIAPHHRVACHVTVQRAREEASPIPPARNGR